MKLTLKQIERFNSSYIPEPNSGCWLWVKGSDTRGYGHSAVNGKTIGSHRLSWMMHKGEILDGKFVLHKCDNPFCVNPDHLFLGSGQDNVDDRSAKMRQARGSKHGISKLTEADVAEIRRSYPLIKGPELARKFNVTETTIYYVVKGQFWAHVKS